MASTPFQESSTANIALFHGRNSSAQLDSWVRRLQLQVLQALCCAAPALNTSEEPRSQSGRIAEEIFLYVLGLCNLLSIGTGHGNWLAKGLSYSRLDTICRALGQSHIFSVSIAALCLLPGSAVLYALVHAKALKRTFLRPLVAFPAFLLSEVVFVPASAALAASVVLPNGDTVYAIALLVLCTVVAVHRALLIDPCNTTLSATLDYTCGVRELIATEALIALYAVGATGWVASIAQIVASVYVSVVYMSRMPYYRKVRNCLVAVKWLLFAWVTFVFQLETMLTSTGFSPLIITCVTPALLYWFLQNWKAAACWFRAHYYNYSTVRLVLLELKLRKLLRTSIIDHSRVVHFFQSAKREHKSVLIISIWESLYYFSNRRDRSVALLRLSLAGGKSTSFAEELLLHRLRSALETGRCRKQWELMTFRQDCEAAMGRDVEACAAFQAFLEEYLKAASAAEVFKRCEKLAAATALAGESYAVLSKQYQHNREVESMRTSFLREVLCSNRELCDLSSAPANKLNASLQYSENAAKMIICAAGPRCGTVEMMNEQCMLLLGIRIEEEMPQLSNLIPPFINCAHNSLLESFAHTAESLSHTHVDTFLATSPCIGVRVRVQSTLLSTGTNAYYECTITNLQPPYQEWALVGSGGEVVLRSRDFWGKLEATEDSGGESAITAIVARSKQEGRVDNFRKEDYCCWDFSGKVLSYSTPHAPHTVAFLSHASSDTSKRPAEVTHSQCSNTPLYGLQDSKQFATFLSRSRQTCRNHTFRLWFYQLATSLIITALLSILLHYYFDIFSALDSVSTVNDMGRRRFRTANIVDCVRELGLIEMGVGPKDRESVIRDNLLQHVTDLKSILESLRNESFSWPAGIHRDFYYQDSVPIWELFGDSIRTRKVTLFDAMGYLVSHGNNIRELQQVNFTHPSVFYVYRNGLGETMDYLNVSTYEYVKMELGVASGMLKALTAATLLSVNSVLLICAILSGYSLYRAERCNSAIWRHLFSLGTETVADRCRVIQRRCESLDSGDVRIFAVPHRPRKPLYYYQCYLPLSVLLLQVVATSAFALYVSLYTEAYITNGLSSKIPYMNWAGVRRWQSAYNYVWIRELYLCQSPTSGYFAIMPESQPLYSVYATTRYMQDYLHLAERLLIYGSADYLIRSVDLSQRHEKMLFSAPCTSLGSVSGCEQSLLSKGMHYGLNAYLLELQTLRDLISDGVATWSDLQSAVEKGRKVGLGFAQLAAIYDEDGTAEVRAAIEELVLSLALYIILALAFVAGIVTCTALRYKRRLGVVLSVCKMMQAIE